MYVKIWLVLLLLVAGPALAESVPDAVAAADSNAHIDTEDEVLGWEPILPEEEDEAIEEAEAELIQVPWAEDPNDVPVNWVDESHAYATNKAQALTEWMDAFFGDPEYDAEQAESLLRLEIANEWDEEDGNDFSARLRGKVQLPSVSRRLNLVFAGEDGEPETEEERREEERIGLKYKVREGSRSRFDMTLNYSSGNVRPGVRYRSEGRYTELTSFRYVQRLQWDNDESFFTTANYDINQGLDEDSILRWANRVRWGEETDGVEWRTRLALRERKKPESSRPIAVSYFASINGETQPEVLTKNYRLGVLWRRQVYRDFLFAEIEPAFNYRRRNLDVEREGVWSIVLRLEIALQRDLRRVR